MNIDTLAYFVHKRILHTPLTAPVIPVQPEPWMDGALCTQADPEMFYPDKGGDPKPAKALCQLCGSRADCLAYALEHNERYGVWGGMTRKERQRIRRAA